MESRKKRMEESKEERRVGREERKKERDGREQKWRREHEREGETRGAGEEERVTIHLWITLILCRPASPRMIQVAIRSSWPSSMPPKEKC